MGTTREHLQRWIEAGLVESDTAARIEQWEDQQGPGRRAEARPGVLEVLLYLGIVVLSVGVFMLFAQSWDELESWARVLAVGTPAALLVGLGAALHLSDEPQLRRGSQAAWLVAVPLFATAFAVTVNELGLGLGDPGDRGALLTIAGATFLVALCLWVVSPSYAQVLALAGATVFFGESAGNWPDDFSPQLAGMTIFGIAAAALVLAEAKWFKPVLGVRVLFSVLLIMGPFQAGVDTGPAGFELLAGAAAVAIVAYGVLRESFLMVLVGVVGAFFVLFNSVAKHFSERLGAPMALMVCGGILVAGVLLLAVYRSRSQVKLAS
ncbi:MAG: DUF2157 domain-containing protein [Dehalococcoidia bacterium]|jgi:hypothetical protein